MALAKRIDEALRASLDAAFAAGQVNPSDEAKAWDDVYARSDRADAKLRRLIFRSLLCVNHRKRTPSRWDAIGCYGTSEEHNNCAEARDILRRNTGC